MGGGGVAHPPQRREEERKGGTVGGVRCKEATAGVDLCVAVLLFWILKWGQSIIVKIYIWQMG